MRHSILFVDIDEIFDCYFFRRNEIYSTNWCRVHAGFEIYTRGNKSTTFEEVKNVIFQCLGFEES
jgi:hypothetical protein